MNVRRHLSALLAAAALVPLAGCELLKKNEAAQATVNARAIGLSIGEFQDRFGRPHARVDLGGGAAAYAWESAVEGTPPGPDSRDQRICKLRIAADRRGQIVSADIVHDGLGRRSTSRCTEIFSPA